MALPLALVPVAISAVRGLIKYRSKLDRIFLDKEATVGLPFLVPPPPPNMAIHIAPMKAYFQTDDGGKLLELTGMTALFETAPDQQSDDDIRNLVQVYLEVQGLSLRSSGPDAVDIVPGGVSESQLAYVIVSSTRLSQNPAIARVLLATADTLLEFGAENAALFIDSPKTAQIVGSVMREFAGDVDLDDLSAEMLVRNLVGAALYTAIDHREELPQHPALAVLYQSLAELKTRKGAQGNDFINTIVTRDGFKNIVQAYMTTASTDARFNQMLGKVATGRAAEDPLAQLASNSFAAMFEELGTNLDEVLNDPAAFAGVLEAGIAIAAGQASAVIEKEIGGEPLTAAVLKSVASEIESRAQSGSADDALFAQMANGELWSALFKTSLAATAANIKAIEDQAGVSTVVAELVGATADVLSKDALARIRDGRGNAVLHQLLSRSLGVLAENPDILSGDNRYAGKLLGAVLEAAAPLIEDGLDAEDVIPILDAAVKAAAGNLALVEMDDRIRDVLSSFTVALRDEGIRPLLTDKGRRDALWAGLDAVAVNPRIWAELAAPGTAEHLQPLISALLKGLRTDPTKLLSGPVLVDAFRGSLSAIGRHGGDWIKSLNAAAEIEAFLTDALQRANAELGKSIDGEVLPAFIERALRGFLKAKLTIGETPIDVAALLDEAVTAIEAWPGD
jgi:hypothetical protein